MRDQTHFHWAKRMRRYSGLDFLVMPDRRGAIATLACNLYDFNVDYRDISQRISVLKQEIQDIRELNDQYLERKVQTQTERAARDAREIRLLQIKEELSKMIKESRHKAPI